MSEQQQIPNFSLEQMAAMAKYVTNWEHSVREDNSYPSKVTFTTYIGNIADSFSLILKGEKADHSKFPTGYSLECSFEDQKIGKVSAEKNVGRPLETNDTYKYDILDALFNHVEGYHPLQSERLNAALDKVKHIFKEMPSQLGLKNQ